MYQGLAQNTKIYFGNSIPNIFVNNDEIFNKQKKPNDHPIKQVAP